MKYKRVLVWVLPSIVIALMAYLLGYSNFLEVKAIDRNLSVDYSTDYSTDFKDLDGVINKPEFHLNLGAKLARVNVRGAEKALAEIPWVAKASVSRNWISGKVSITIEPRVPIATVINQASGTAAYIDKTGVVYRDPNFKGSLPSISISNSKNLERVAGFVAQLPSELIDEMKNLTLSASGDLEMQISNGNQSISVNWGDGSKFEAKWLILQKLILLPENKSLSEVDLSDPKNPLVRN